jgi:hypothetical protein
MSRAVLVQGMHVWDTQSLTDGVVERTKVEDWGSRILSATEDTHFSHDSYKPDQEYHTKLALQVRSAATMTTLRFTSTTAAATFLLRQSYID